MIQKFRFIIILCFSVLKFSELNAQPSWNYFNTGMNHTILIQNSIPLTIDGIQINSGDYIGVFYETNSGLMCGGYLHWFGTTMTIAAWGLEPGLDNGFSVGETFKWKIWRASDNQEFTATATYNTVQFPDSGKYKANGLSGLASLIAVSTFSFPTWNFTATNHWHAIEIPQLANITVNNNPIVSGDWIGVFYDSSGVLKCGGYIIRNTANQILTAYGKDENADNGFENGESFIWKIWKSSGSVETTTNPAYDLSYQNTGNFVENGLSKLLSLTAFTGDDIGISFWLFPFSGCETLTDSEHIKVRINNYGSNSISGFLVKLMLDGNLICSETFTNNLNINESFDYEFATSVNLSAIDSFQCSVIVESITDVNHNNDTINMLIYNLNKPDLFFQNLSSSYCTSVGEVHLSALPSGGFFFGPSVANDTFYTNFPGNYNISYSFTNFQNGCSNTISQNVTVNASPEIELGENENHCFGESVSIEVPTGYQNYLWSNGETDSQIFATATGYYSVTVTAENACFSTDEIHFTFYPVPSVNISGIDTACFGDLVTLSTSGNYDMYLWNTNPISFEPEITVSESGIYSLTVFKNNCSNADTFQVIFLQPPIVEIFGQDSACVGDKVLLSVDSIYELYFWSNSISLFENETTVENSGMYSVTVSNAIGCLSSDSLFVEFFAFPNIDFGTFESSCIGDSVELNPGKADSYLWNNGSTSSKLFAYETGTYSVTITSEACSSNSSVYIQFDSSPNVSFNFYQNVNVVSFTNTSTISNYYEWNFGDGNNSNSYSPEHEYLNTGQYVVTLFSENYCGSDIYVDTILVENTFSEKEISNASIVPNPNNGIFNIKFVVSKDVNIIISIFSDNGTETISNIFRKLQKGENTIEFNISDFSSGIYSIKIASLKENFILKEIKIN